MTEQGSDAIEPRARTVETTYGQGGVADVVRDLMSTALYGVLSDLAANPHLTGVSDDELAHMARTGLFRAGAGLKLSGMTHYVARKRHEQANPQDPPVSPF